MIPLRSLLALVTKRSEHPAGPSKRPHPFRPVLEALEARDAPSGLGHPTDYTGFLTDTGGKGGGEGYVIVGKGSHVTIIPGN